MQMQAYIKPNQKEPWEGMSSCSRRNSYTSSKWKLDLFKAYSIKKKKKKGQLILSLEANTAMGVMEEGS